MRVKLLTFRYSATLGGFDDTHLVEFLRDKEVIAFREHFYAVNDVPHISCVVHYQDAIVPQAALDAGREMAPRSTAAGAQSPRFQRRNGAPDPCEGLNEAERVLFNHLREWRSRTAHEEGVPRYVILTNVQLVALVRQRPDSPTALGHVPGIGPGKVERYGAAILGCLHGQGGARQALEAVPQVASPDVAQPDSTPSDVQPAEASA